ncbi:hypothetical protein Tco_0367373 [Tanacetum coccineum]
MGRESDSDFSTEYLDSDSQGTWKIVHVFGAALAEATTLEASKNRMRVQEHQYITNLAEKERKKRYDYRPIIEHDGGMKCFFKGIEKLSLGSFKTGGILLVLIFAYSEISEDEYLYPRTAQVGKVDHV